MEARQRTYHLIQVLRAGAALLVVLFHAQSAFAEVSVVRSPAWQDQLFGVGPAGVHIFFVISGFIMVITSRFEPGFEAAGFMKRRLLRIYPIYWICVAAYLLVHSLLEMPYEIAAPRMVGALLLLPGDAPAVIGPAWTLSFEMFFYLSFGVAMLLGLNRGFVVLAGTFVALIAAGLLLRPNSPLLQLATSSLLLEFLAGMAIGWMCKRELLPRRGAVGFLILAIALFASGVALGYDRLPSVITWGIPSTFLVLGAVCFERSRGAKVAIRRIGLLGDSSYALYLIHILLITVALSAATEFPSIYRLDPAVAAICLAPICILAAELLHRCLERPLLRVLNPRRALVPQREDDPAKA